MKEQGGFIDLTDPMNSIILEESKGKGPVGEFVTKLLDKGRAEKRKVYVKGPGTSTFTVKYGNETVDFILKASVDPGDAPIESAHYELWMIDYKKPWVRSLINPKESAEWLRLLPINFADLVMELTGKELKLNILQQQFPKLTYSEMIRVIDQETTAFDEFFTYKMGVSAGAWGFYMEFKIQDMYEQYLNNNAVLMERLQTITHAFVPKIMDRLQKLNEGKST